MTSLFYEITYLVIEYNQVVARTNLNQFEHKTLSMDTVLVNCALYQVDLYRKRSEE